MNIILNEYNLSDNDIDIYEEKARALLVKDDSILVVDYGNTILLPGGKIEDEDKVDALIRELKEEIGISYTKDELNPLCNLIYYQANYPTRKNTIKNRCIKTYIYIGKYKGFDLDNLSLSDNEKKTDFNIKLIKIHELYENIKHITDNPRSKYFNKELKTILDYYKENNGEK